MYENVLLFLKHLFQYFENCNAKFCYYGNITTYIYTYTQEINSFLRMRLKDGNLFSLFIIKYIL